MTMALRRADNARSRCNRSLTAQSDDTASVEIERGYAMYTRSKAGIDLTSHKRAAKMPLVIEEGVEDGVNAGKA